MTCSSTRLCAVQLFPTLGPISFSYSSSPRFFPHCEILGFTFQTRAARQHRTHKQTANPNNLLLQQCLVYTATLLPCLLSPSLARIALVLVHNILSTPYASILLPAGCCRLHHECSCILGCESRGASRVRARAASASLTLGGRLTRVDFHICSRSISSAIHAS